jgi:hypothetical protein
VIGETAIIVEDRTARAACGATLAELVTFAESTAPHTAAYAMLDNIVIANEAVQAQGGDGGGGVAVNEAWTISEAVDAQCVYHQVVSETASLAEGATAAYAARANLNEWVDFHNNAKAKFGLVFLLDETLVLDDAANALATSRVAVAEALQWREATNMPSTGTVSPIYVLKPTASLLFHLVTDGPGAPPVRVPAAQVLRDFGLHAGALARTLARVATNSTAWPALNDNPRVQIACVPIPGNLNKFPSTGGSADIRFAHDPVDGNVIEFDAPTGVVDIGVRISYVHSIVAG